MFGAAEAESRIAELLAAFMGYAMSYYGPGKRGTYANMKRAVQPLRRLYSRTNAAEFGPHRFKAVRQTLIDADQSRTYINETMRRMVQVFRWGAAEGLISAAVAQTPSIISGLRYGAIWESAERAERPGVQRGIDSQARKPRRAA